MNKLQVRGQVRWVDGQPAAGLTVRAFDKDLRHEELLGEAITDQAGLYEINYTAEQFRRDERETADLIFHLSNTQGETLTISAVIVGDQQLDPSAIIFNAPVEAKIDLVIEPEVNGLSEYERFMLELAPVLENIPVADLTEKDVEFIAGETSIDWTNFKLLILAHHYAALTGSRPEFFYVLLRAQMPSDPLALLTQTSDKLRLDLLNAIRDNIVSEIVFSEGSIDQDIEAAKARWEEVADEEQGPIKGQLHAMERIYNVVPRFDSMQSLMGQVISSAREISDLPSEAFFGDDNGSEQNINDVPSKDSSEDEEEVDET